MLYERILLIFSVVEVCFHTTRVVVYGRIFYTGKLQTRRSGYYMPCNSGSTGHRSNKKHCPFSTRKIQTFSIDSFTRRQISRYSLVNVSFISGRFIRVQLIIIGKTTEIRK